MIGKLKGILAEVESNRGLIETAGGVFYTVFLTPLLLKREVKKEIEAYTYLHVREDNVTLYGFENKKQYKIFEMLLTVSGIGPKSAFTIICHRDADAILKAVADHHIEFFSDISGIGRKTAQKILLELSQKIGKAFDVRSLVVSRDDTTVIDALVSLGFVKHEARRAVVDLDKHLSIEEKIKAAIKTMTKKQT